MQVRSIRRCSSRKEAAIFNVRSGVGLVERGTRYPQAERKILFVKRPGCMRRELASEIHGLKSNPFV